LFTGLTDYVLSRLINLRLTLGAFGGVLIGVPLAFLLSFGTLWRNVQILITTSENVHPRYPFRIDKTK